MSLPFEEPGPVEKDWSDAISPIEEIINDARNGRMFILVDHEDRGVGAALPHLHPRRFPLRRDPRFTAQERLVGARDQRWELTQLDRAQHGRGLPDLARTADEGHLAVLLQMGLQDGLVDSATIVHWNQFTMNRILVNTILRWIVFWSDLKTAA